MNKNSWLLLGAGLAALVVIFASAGAPPGGPTPANTDNWKDTMVANNAPSPLVGGGTRPASDLYYTPEPFTSVLKQPFSLPTLKAAAVSSLQRYLISASPSSYFSIGLPSGTAPTTLSLTGPASTVQAILSQLVEAVSEPAVTGGFRLDSELHALYSVDVGPDGSSLVFHNAWGTAPQPSGRGYLVFTYDAASKLLRARARFSYDPVTYTRTRQTSFRQKDYYVAVGAASASLVESADQASAVTFYESPIPLSMPENFNPAGIPYQPNPRVSLTKRVVEVTEDQMIGPRGKLWQDLDPAYQAQVSQPGDDPGTEAAAVAMLDQIAQNSTLRYPKEVYLAFRRGLLRTTLASDGVANGTWGMQAVPYVYFTDAADTKGVHHPFLCLATYSITDRPNRLVDVRRPPGDGSGGEYSAQAVTRDAALQLDLIKIPLKDYGVVSKLTDNTMMRTLKSDARSTAADSVYNYTSISGVGVAVDGSEIYPVLNNTLATTQQSAEITSIGNHVGRGMGLHYHADGHIAMNNGVQLYNISDYHDRSHPPLIGFGLDGVALYGVYEQAFASMEGISVPLDSFGGHSHGTFGYHYHSHLVTTAADGRTAPYILDVLIKGAWKGRINEIPEFWDRRGDPAISMAQQHPYVGKRDAPPPPR